MRPKLTDRQQDVLDFIVEAIKAKGYPPTLREISSRFDISSTQGVRRHIDALESKGYIFREPGARSMMVASDILDLSTLGKQEVVLIPILGDVAAGQPIFAEEHAEDHVTVSTDWLGPRGEHFFLKVKGLSMADSILPNDLVLVEKAQVASNGEIVVALLENEATVKRFFRSGSRIELRSDNPDYDHIIPQEDFQILGRVTALMRRY